MLDLMANGTFEFRDCVGIRSGVDRGTRHGALVFGID